MTFCDTGSLLTLQCYLIISTSCIYPLIHHTCFKPKKNLWIFFYNNNNNKCDCTFISSNIITMIIGKKCIYVLGAISANRLQRQKQMEIKNKPKLLNKSIELQTATAVVVVETKDKRGMCDIDTKQSTLSVQPARMSSLRIHTRACMTISFRYVYTLILQ